MQILLLGATGRTGHPVLLEALARGHHVTALVRDPARAPLDALVPDERDRLTLVTGSPLNADDVRRALLLAAADGGRGTADVVVISTLNARRTSDSPFAAPHPTDSPPRMMADSAVNVVAAFRAAALGGGVRGVGKMVVLSALGAGSSAPHASCALRALVRHSGMRAQYEDHAAVEAVLMAAARGKRGPRVEFVLVRPTRLVDGDGDDGAARVVDVSGGRAVVPMLATVSRGAVARFLVDAAEGSKWDGRAPIIVG